MTRDMAGLCTSCLHSQTIRSSKGATFIRCERSFADSRFARYPALPVRECPGFSRADRAAQGLPPATPEHDDDSTKT